MTVRWKPAVPGPEHITGHPVQTAVGAEILIAPDLGGKT